VGIFVFAFVYRLVMLLGQTFPPGADIGCHASVINSITQGGHTNFLQNFYQMGGELGLAFPGFHIVAAQVILFTGLSSYVAQALVAALFSAFIVLAVFLVTRVVWSAQTAFIVALLVTFSSLDVEILCWGGYPNAVVLFLMPVMFYLFLRRDKLSRGAFYVSASLVAAAIFLTHSLSAAVFSGIVILALGCVLVFPRLFDRSRKFSLSLALPLVVGLVLVSPFLVSAIPVYLSESTVLVGSIDIAQVLILERTIPIWAVLTLFVGVGAYFWFSKKIKHRFFVFSVFLLAMWLLVPLLLTQSYRTGLYLDGLRFPYFFIHPVLILFALIIDSISKYPFRVNICNICRNKKKWLFCKLDRKIPLNTEQRRKGCSVFLILILLGLMFGAFILRFPWDVRHQEFYQVMDAEGYQAIRWAKQNTSADAVFVSDMSYGWWMAGFGQRPTISSIDLQAISIMGEVNMARNVSYLLNTNYVLDNGYVQVREDGGYLGRHNPLFLVNLKETIEPYEFFAFNSSQITLHYEHNEKGTQVVNVSDLPVVDMGLAYADPDSSPAIVVNRANSEVSFLEIVTLTPVSQFANLTLSAQSLNPNITLDRLELVVDSPGTLLQQTTNETVAVLDLEANICGQLIFAHSTPTVTSRYLQDRGTTQLSYAMQDMSGVEVQILVGMFSAANIDLQNLTGMESLEQILRTNLQTPAGVPELAMTIFDYRVALQQYNVSYVVNRNFELNPKYANDPVFSSVFINNKVAIFKVETNTHN
jgi:hypothetical protein